MQPYNLPAMVQIVKNSNFKAVFCKLDLESGEYELKELNRKITKKTLAVVVTHIFSTHITMLKLKKLCKKKNIILIEDVAIYFDNYTLIGKKNRKIYAGSYGDYSLYSFNIMKNISAFFGGGVAANDKKFKISSESKIKKYKSFNNVELIKQVIIYFILKIFSIKLFYKHIFFKILKRAHISNNFFLTLIYPSLKFKKNKKEKNYFTKISVLSKKNAYLQIINRKMREKNHQVRKKNNILYYNYLQKMNIKKIKYLDIKDFNFQNFLDFPIFVENKKKLNDYLLEKGIETKFINYQNCSDLFIEYKNLSSSRSARYFTQKTVSLPNHKKITENYIIYILKQISIFYDRKN